MNETTIDILNQQFAVPGHIRFRAGPGGFPVADIRNAHGAGTISLYGAQPLHFQPLVGSPVLWLSEHAVYAAGQAIRGGIPICWPWFGPHPTDATKPSHGFARTRMWQVEAASGAPGGASVLRLGLSDDEETRALWPFAFSLQLTVTLSTRLRVELSIHNPGDELFTYTGALHSYFTIGDIGAITIHGLENTPYIDQVDQRHRKIQTGPIAISEETDRVYLGTGATCTIEDQALGRQIEAAKSGSRSTVVWNPWVDKSRSLADFGDDEYHRMVCVETANAFDDQVTVPAGGGHKMSVIIGVAQSDKLAVS
jgi:glucose-6-phosphate 1-epimerase